MLTSLKTVKNAINIDETTYQQEIMQLLRTSGVSVFYRVNV